MQAEGLIPRTRPGICRVEFEDDAQGDHLAVRGREARERLPEPGGESLGLQLLRPLGEARIARLASTATLFRSEVVEGRRAGDLAEPGAL